MITYFLRLMFLTLATCGLSKAFAQNVQLGQAQMAGAGCPAGTAVAVLSPTNDTISILFSAFQISKEPEENITNIVTNCRVIIPVTVAPGFAMTAYQLDYRGYLRMEDPKGSFIFRSMPVVNPQTPVKPKDLFLTGFYDGPLEISHTLNSYRCNTCGGKFNLQVELSLGIYGEGRFMYPLKGTAIATIDSADGFVPTPDGNGVHMKFGLVPCQQQTQNPRPNIPTPPPYYPPIQPPPQPQPRPQPALILNPAQCYLNRYPDICQNSPKNFCKDPMKHYRQIGIREGRFWGCG